MSEDLRLIFLVSALYWDFSKDFTKLTSPKIYGWKQRKINQIFIKNTLNRKNFILTKRSFKNFDKNLLTHLSTVRQSEVMELKLQFQPQTFVHLINTTLTTNTFNTIRRENNRPNLPPYDELWSCWGGVNGGDFGYEESWRVF